VPTSHVCVNMYVCARERVQRVPTTCGAHLHDLPSSGCSRPRMSAATDVLTKVPLDRRTCRLALTLISHICSLSVVSSFEQTDGTQHLPLYMPQLKSPAARRCFPSAPFPSQPAEAGNEEDAAADACDEADVHALVGRGRRYNSRRRRRR